MIEKGAVLPMFYLPPVEYFVKLNIYKPHILIESEEHFPKQTYRNRANIYSPDGVLALVVPVIKGSKNHTKAKDVKIKSAKSKNGKLRCQRQLNNRKMQNAKGTQHVLKRKTSKKEKKE